MRRRKPRRPRPPPLRARHTSCFRRCRRRCCRKCLRDGSQPRPEKVTDAAKADPDNAAALKEYDFTDGALATYKRSGETLTLRALRFEDASGAYGAYSSIATMAGRRKRLAPGPHPTTTGCSSGWATWSSTPIFRAIGPMCGAELRELAASCRCRKEARRCPADSGQPAQSIARRPDHPLCAGTGGLCGRGRRTAAGAGGFRPRRRGRDRQLHAALEPGHADHHRLSHAADGRRAGDENSRLHQGRQTGAAGLAQAADGLRPASLEVRRSGPLVALVSGDAIPDESHKLLATVHYEADLTSIPQPTEIGGAQRPRKLLLGIAGLVIIGASAAFLLGFFLGGFRALYRIARGKPVSSIYDDGVHPVSICGTDGSGKTRESESRT